jgi:xylulokinase
MAASRHVLAIDLGTSRLKAGIVSDRLVTVAAARAPYEMISDAPGMAEQRPGDWLHALHSAVAEAFAGAEGVTVEAVVLTGQMPTLVCVADDGSPLGNAVTWQDSRADDFVRTALTAEQATSVRRIAGTPIDGRYLIPMHRWRERAGAGGVATLLSAKDFLYAGLTGRRVTDPSTASGFGNYSLDEMGWSAELTALWSLAPEMLPEVAPCTFHAPLSAAGAAQLAGRVAPGTPVVVGGADSVCAHHFITSQHPGAVSIIDGSSTVIMSSLDAGGTVPDDVLVTPLVDARQRGVELDLLATGSTIGWLAEILGLEPLALEATALAHPAPAEADVVLQPYLAGGEQGALWLNHLTGSIRGLTRATSRADLALAAFEGIAFETERCLRLLARSGPVGPLVSIGAPHSHHLSAGIVAALGGYRVVATSHQSPSLLGAAIVGFQALDPTFAVPQLLAESDALPSLSEAYRASLNAKAAHYFAESPAPAPDVEVGA